LLHSGEGCYSSNATTTLRMAGGIQRKRRKPLFRVSVICCHRDLQVFLCSTAALVNNSRVSKRKGKCWRCLGNKNHLFVRRAVWLLQRQGQGLPCVGRLLWVKASGSQQMSPAREWGTTHPSQRGRDFGNTKHSHRQIAVTRVVGHKNPSFFSFTTGNAGIGSLKKGCNLTWLVIGGIRRRLESVARQ